MTCSDKRLAVLGPQLAAAVDDAVYHGFVWAWTGLAGTPKRPQEPDLVAGIVLEGLPLFEKEWAVLLAPEQISVRTAGVYCHQRRYVKFNGQFRCELGDLLVVHIHVNPHGETFRSALLLQAKLSDNTPGPGDPQLLLYTKWPEITYDTGAHKSEKRQVTPASRFQGAQYLVLSSDSSKAGFPFRLRRRNPPEYPLAQVAMPSNSLLVSTSLGEDMSRMPLGLSGRYFADRSDALNEVPGDWSRVVWDLLEDSVNASFNRKRMGGGPYPRFSAGDLSGLDGVSTVPDGGLESLLGIGPRDLRHSNLEGARDDRFGGSVSVMAVQTKAEREGIG